jgi:hypothetical protein
MNGRREFKNAFQELAVLFLSIPIVRLTMEILGKTG